MNLLEVLKKHPHFGCMPESELKKFAKHFSAYQFEPGKKIISQDQPATICGIIQSGFADIAYHFPGQKEVAFQSIGPGDFFGMLPLFTGGNSMISVICRKTVTCWAIDHYFFLQTLETLPEIRQYFYQIAFERIRHAYQQMSRKIGSADPAENFQPLPRLHRIEKSIRFINRNFSQPLTLDMIAGEIGMSTFHFSRLFKTETGFSFKGYLNHQRILAAKTLLKDHELNISEICFLIGYNDLSYFCRVFHKLTGVSPGRYRSEQSQQTDKKEKRISQKKTNNSQKNEGNP
ncbi:MAG: helix-turn-helix domain-containing protein [Pseudomonadota bacterium]